MRRYDAAVFDMDGTILDTIEDLRDALNHSLKQFGHKGDYTTREVCLFFGSGARAGVMRALAAEQGATEAEILRIGEDQHSGETPDGGRSWSDFAISDETVSGILEFYAPWYREHCAIKTGPYPGIIPLIGELSAAGVRSAVVSNKPDPAVQMLCRDYFPDVFDFSLGEIAGIRRKPFPDMVLRCLEALHVPADRAVYIGDSEIDIRTAANAGLDCISVDWGFRSRAFLEKAGSTRIASSCDEVADIILGRKQE